MHFQQHALSSVIWQIFISSDHKKTVSSFSHRLLQQIIIVGSYNMARIQVKYRILHNITLNLTILQNLPDALIIFLMLTHILIELRDLQEVILMFRQIKLFFKFFNKIRPTRHTTSCRRTCTDQDNQTILSYGLLNLSNM